jgi:hypothetical protein
MITFTERTWSPNIEVGKDGIAVGIIYDDDVSLEIDHCILTLGEMSEITQKLSNLQIEKDKKNVKSA